MKTRYLTKSRCSLAFECPTKLYYSGKDDYINLKSEDSFLEGLAENGYQVAELAKCYFPAGILISATNNEEAISQTNELMLLDKVTIFEGAFKFNNLFLRADILEKNGNSIKLIEVKSKSFNGREKTPFLTKRGEKKIISEWRKYIFDVAFQKLVLSRLYPDMNITSFLMLTDTSVKCSSTGLNQRFRIIKESGNKVKVIVTEGITDNDIQNPILKAVNIDEELNIVYQNYKFINNLKFNEYVDYLSECYKNDIKIKPNPGKVCKKCEFRCPKNEVNGKSGFHECWTESFGFTPSDFSSSSILDIWFLDLDKFIHSGICRVSQINEDEINVKPSSGVGLSRSQRQWLQIEKAQVSDNTIFIDQDNLKTCMKEWVYPLHFIDFETIMPAIPFNQGEHPYQALAFQFSHHILFEDGTVEHAGQFINDKIGINPNLDFIRNLKSNLENDHGTIFRYHSHENTYLNKIYHQLNESIIDIPDKAENLEFIKDISHSSNDSAIKWNGKRDMVDLQELVVKFYYDPLTNGSNSIKQVFPAILNRSDYLKQKYSKPIYGSKNGIKSLNFKDWQWINITDGKANDPYLMLPKLFSDIDISEEELDLLFNDDIIKGGGAASIAYSRLQFCEMSDIERTEIMNALLKYCELDTLAMVMIVEAWKSILQS